MTECCAIHSIASIMGLYAIPQDLTFCTVLQNLYTIPGIIVHTTVFNVIACTMHISATNLVALPVVLLIKVYPENRA